jgi:putative hydrolase of the HAD superfamily
VTDLKAVLWDFGGVILDSPFDAFNRYEAANGLPKDLLRTLNATNPDTNAWAQLERSAVPFPEFCRLYEAEAAAQGHTIDAAALFASISGAIRVPMVDAIKAIKAKGLKTALLTNNWLSEEVRSDDPYSTGRVLQLFDAIVESSKVGVRKPEVRFYEIACELLAVEPDECVFLDDLGINLKPAKAMGMQTIKVLSVDQALGELEAIVGFALR